MKEVVFFLVVIIVMLLFIAWELHNRESGKQNK